MEEEAMEDWDMVFEALVCQDLDRIEETMTMNAKGSPTQQQPEPSTIHCHAVPDLHLIGQTAILRQPQPSTTIHLAGAETKLSDYLIDFDPPIELSQNLPEARRSGFDRGRRNRHHGDGGKEEEIQNMKKGLMSVHEKLTYQEHECSELLKDRGRKEEQLKKALAQIVEKDLEIQRLQQTTLRKEDSGEELQISLPCDHAMTPSQGNSLGDAKSTASSWWTRGRASKRLLRDTSNLPAILEKPSLGQFENCDLKKRSIQPNGLSMVSDLKNRLSIDGGSNIGRHDESLMQVVEIVGRGTTATTKSTKNAGTQIDLSDESNHTIRKKDIIEQYALPAKLIEIWKPEVGKGLGQKLVRKLFATCASDFFSLFRFIGMPTLDASGSLSDGNCSNLITSHHNNHLQSTQGTEASKVECLYSTLTKVMNDMAQLDTLLEALLDLCSVLNVDIVHRSLHIIHVILHYTLVFYSDCSQRSNIVVNHTGISKNDLDNEMPLLLEYRKRRKVSEDMVRVGGSSLSVLSRMEFLSMGKMCREKELLIHNLNINWLSLFEVMHQIAAKNKNHHIQLEAISIMNLILMSNPVSGRDRFGTVDLLGSISLLLKQGVALVVQLQAVRLLFLLLNCEDVMKLFAGNLKDGANCIQTDLDTLDAPLLPTFSSSILEGLAEGVSCTGDGTQELVLRRHGIHVFAFIMASGDAATKILKSGVYGRIDLLELLVKVLVSELDTQDAELFKPTTDSLELFKERTSLIREALILLCRLVSHPVHSTAVLQALASNGKTLKSTIDIAHRLIARAGRLGKVDGTNRADLNQADIIELARVLRSRTNPLLRSIS